MKNILKIFIGDLARIRHNVVAMIIILGLAVLPCMYAWFNIAASWDPYGNTGNLKVAIANTDAGYQSDLMPLELNVGEKIENALHSNDSICWVFTTEKDAISGVRSGKYYASLVITKDFSKNIMSLFTDHGTNPVICYYSNQKTNAISPKVTDKASGALQETIGEMFMETLSKVLINSLSNVSAYLDQDKLESGLTEIDSRLKVLQNDVDSTAEIVDAFVSMTDSLEGLCDTAADMVDQTDGSDSTDRNRLSEASLKVKNLSSSMKSISKKIDKLLSDTSSAYAKVEDKIDESFETLSDDRTALSADLLGLAYDVQVLIDRYTAWKEDLEELENALSEDEAAEAVIRKALDRLITRLDRAIEKQSSLKEKLTNTEELLSDIDRGIKSSKKDLEEKAKSCRKSLKALQKEYSNHTSSSLSGLASLLADAGDDTAEIRSILERTSTDSGNLLLSSSATLADTKKLLEDTAQDIRAASKRLNKVISSIKDGLDTDDSDMLERLLSNDGDLLASLWASPVQLDSRQLYEIENYGSSMAPFYTALSTWVGGVVMVSMIKTMLSKKRIKELEKDGGKVSLTQQYLGRYLTFMAIGLIQSTLICLGDLYFLGIQCRHPLLFMLTGWTSSMVYVLMIYTLTLSFGDIGKAICVVLMVMQVAGTGGTFPIETAPAISKVIYPFLPFVHTMNALRECIAGMYKNTYWIEMRTLVLYLIPTLILGLFLRRPVIRFNHFFEEKLEEVKFM